MGDTDANGKSEGIKTFKNLISEVHEIGLCGSCGGCVSFCSADELGAIGFGDDGKPRYIEEGKCLECGICYLICPQIDVLDEDIKETFCWESPMGSFRRIVSARSTNPEILKSCTDGGVVSSILHCLLDLKMTDGAVVSKKTSQFTREPMIATTFEEILAAAGSRFTGISGVQELSRFSTYSPTMFAIREVKNMDLIKIAVVGTPCQIHTLRKMQDLSVVPSHVVKFVLGLFCSENFSFDFSKEKDVERALGVNIKDIEKMNIKEDLILNLRNGETKHIPLEKMRSFVRPACLACTDFANDFADISFGGLGSPEGWTTLIIRTDVGEAIFSEALRHDYIEEQDGDRRAFEMNLSDIKSKLMQFAEMKNERGRKTRRGI
ncbi:MAG: Coenzyme F420 hydrogenase/dehydrogenase, beta subunit C-terminal domain [Thermoplasmata archaeon]|nr:MAG: Coenzyme F420 hydrogenase/dehydrogenase, beta subunit C-terminal domain [Thermoplasmata archaeon]